MQQSEPRLSDFAAGGIILVDEFDSNNFGAPYDGTQLPIWDPHNNGQHADDCTLYVKCTMSLFPIIHL